MGKENLPPVTRERVRQQHQQPELIPGFFFIVLGITLISATWYFFAGPGSVRATFDYSANDIAHEQPLHAVHEVSGNRLESIPFLPQDGPQPRITLAEDFYDFGSVGPADVVSHDFVIINQGEAPLTISRAYTTCGCTTADFTATVISPGKVVVVTMIYDAGFHDVRGQTVRRGIIIENNDPKNPQVELWGQAAVRAHP